LSGAMNVVHLEEENELEFTLDPHETTLCERDARKVFFKKSPLDGAIESEVDKPVVLSWRLKERMKVYVCGANWRDSTPQT